MSAETDKARIGFVGVGLMGEGMASRLIGAGHPLTALAHRNRAPLERLMAQGAREAMSARVLAQESEVIFLCVTGSPQVEAVMRGPDGILAGARPGLIVADCSTADPNSTLALAAEALDQQGRVGERLGLLDQGVELLVVPRHRQVEAA